MKSNVICGLKGEYRVDIFSGDTFIRSTDWFSNDITNTGMLYPFVYPFARCFMFLSLGSGQITSTGPGGISGLQNETGFNITNGGTPIMGYQTLTGIQSGNYMGWKNYRTGNKSTTACGTQFTRNGLSFFRGWQVPSGGEAVGGNGLNISSFMVSPSSGSDPTGKYAFSMINQNVSIPSGYNATIFYRLSLNFPDYTNQYNLFAGGTLGQNGYFDTSNATVGGLDTTLINGWKNLGGMYRQLFPGLQCVDNLGGCVVPPNYGAMLEPNISDAYNLYFYLSPDIGQYATSKYARTGYIGNQESGAYNAIGLSANYSEFDSYLSEFNPTASNINMIVNGTIAGEPDTYYYSGDNVGSVTTATPQNLTEMNTNIHLDHNISVSGYNTFVPNFTYAASTRVNATGNSVDYASPGGTLLTTNVPNYGQPAVFSTSLKRIPTNPIPGSRTQKVTKTALISPIQALGWNARYGTLVLANLNGFTTPETVVAYPYMEYLFFDSSGKAANTPHYRVIPEIYLANRGTGVYQAIFSITGAGIDGGINSPIQNFWNATGFMGGYTGANPSGIDTSYPASAVFPTTSWSTGFVFSGDLISNTLTGAMSGDSQLPPNGFGAVYGILAKSSGFYGSFDMCLIDKPSWSSFTGEMNNGVPNPTGETGLMCWPQSGKWMGLNITGMQYYSPRFNQVVVDTNDSYVGAGYQFLLDVTTAAGESLIGTTTAVTSLSFTLDSNDVTVTMRKNGSTITGYSLTSPSFSTFLTYNLNKSQIETPLDGTSAYKLKSTNFCKPSGNIHHLESYNGTGYRLLPNYAIGNNNWVSGNTYVPIRGGAFPGLSSENGMQLYFDFVWSA